MCQESLIAYLETNTSIAKEKIRQFVLSPEEGVVGIPEIKKPKLLFALENVKICDPAIGSGAFPMGLLNALLHCREALCGEHYNRAEIKKSIIQNNIYGVDIEKGAVDIARLRFWLSIVVDEEIPSPLPNLDYKIMQGNSLIESFMGVDLSKLTYEKEDKKDKGEILLFDDEKNRLQKTVSHLLSSYYSCSDHDRKEKLQQKITDTINKQLEAQAYDPAILGKLKTINLAENNQFFLWHTWYSDVFNRTDGKNGFDIVIGNPPYIKEGRMSKTYFAPYKDSPYYRGKMDIWYLFACYGLDMLNAKGSLCFIATNNWGTSFGASKLRDKVIKETRICNIVDFGAVMMFESASIQTMIMMFQKDCISDNYTFDYRKLIAVKATEKDAIAILNKTSSDAEYYTPVVCRANYYNKNITFSLHDVMLDKISNLKDVIFLKEDELTSGIHPHYDFINKRLSEKYGFVIGEGIFGLSNYEINSLSLTDNEKQFIKPYYNSSDNVTRYLVGDSELSIIYTTSMFKNPNSMDAYPHLKAHLDRFKDVISSDNKPYGLHRARVESFFNGEKVVALRKCAGRPIFAYAEGANYMSATFYVIKTNRVNMKYLTGLLNSRLIEYWLKNRGKMQGANYQLDKEPLLQIPIAVPSFDLQESVANIVDKIISIIRSNNNQETLLSLEQQIDNVIYKLYALTDAEINIIEQNV